MDLRQYFTDKKAKQAELEKKFSDGVVHVTSVFYRERNSTAGATSSATVENAARVITDGTHREATEDEIAAFYARQKSDLEKHIRAEQVKKQQYVVVTQGEFAPVREIPSAVVPVAQTPTRGQRQDSSKSE